MTILGDELVRAPIGTNKEPTREDIERLIERYGQRLGAMLGFSIPAIVNLPAEKRIPLNDPITLSTPKRGLLRLIHLPIPRYNLRYLPRNLIESLPRVRILAPGRYRETYVITTFENLPKIHVHTTTSDHLILLEGLEESVLDRNTIIRLAKYIDEHLGYVDEVHGVIDNRREVPEFILVEREDLRRRLKAVKLTVRPYLLDIDLPTKVRLALELRKRIVYAPITPKRVKKTARYYREVVKRLGEVV